MNGPHELGGQADPGTRARGLGPGDPDLGTRTRARPGAGPGDAIRVYRSSSQVNYKC